MSDLKKTLDRTEYSRPGLYSIIIYYTYEIHDSCDLEYLIINIKHTQRFN